MKFQHNFDPTMLREYDIRGIVGKTLHEADAFAIGRCFGSVVVRGGGTVVAVGYDGRLSSLSLEAALVAGLKASGAEVVRDRAGADADAVLRGNRLESGGRHHADRQP
jgi:phosphomannomutase